MGGGGARGRRGGAAIAAGELGERERGLAERADVDGAAVGERRGARGDQRAERAEIAAPVQEQLIVELYSK